MKLRILGDSIRLRLKRSEVKRIASGESIVEMTSFPGSTLRYSLGTGADPDGRASFEDGCVHIALPREQVLRWASSDSVSIYSEQPVKHGQSLSLLVEKDFECLSPGEHRSCGEDHDTYPHPGGSC